MAMIGIEDMLKSLSKCVRTFIAYLQVAASYNASCYSSMLIHWRLNFSCHPGQSDFKFILAFKAIRTRQCTDADST
jgi:hypothetical protein